MNPLRGHAYIVEIYHKGWSSDYSKSVCVLSPFLFPFCLSASLFVSLLCICVCLSVHVYVCVCFLSAMKSCHLLHTSTITMFSPHCRGHSWIENYKTVNQIKISFDELSSSGIFVTVMQNFYISNLFHFR